MCLDGLLEIRRQKSPRLLAAYYSLTYSIRYVSYSLTVPSILRAMPRSAALAWSGVTVRSEQGARRR